MNVVGIGRYELMIKLEFSKEMYFKESLLKAAYLFLDRAYILLDATSDKYIVELKMKDARADGEIEDEFKNELLAQTVRKKISKDTEDIRKLLLARALASSVVDTVTYVKDAEIENNSREHLDQILTDWFDNT